MGSEKEYTVVRISLSSTQTNTHMHYVQFGMKVFHLIMLGTECLNRFFRALAKPAKSKPWFCSS